MYTQSSATTRPFSPTASLVVTDQSRATPSSCACEERNLFGQSGHTMPLFSRSGGFGMISICVIAAANHHDMPVLRGNPIVPGRCRLTIAGAALVLLHQEIHREMDAVQRPV